MGLLDHRRTWRYVVQATPRQCTDAFSAAFTGRGGLMMKAEWSVSHSRGGSRAVYRGRKGLGALGGVLSRTAALEQDTAIGSTVTFEIEESRGAQTSCVMWLSSSGRAGIAGLLGATSDSRFIRPYMRAVEDELRRIDPSLRVAKGLLGAEGESLDAIVPPPAQAPAEPEPSKAEWAAIVAVDPGQTWTCPVCSYAKNPGGRVRCAQCRREIGRV